MRNKKYFIAHFLEAFTNWLEIVALFWKDDVRPKNPPYSLSNTRFAPNLLPYSLIKEPIRE